MKVFHVAQVAHQGHNTSYKTGRTWLSAHDTHDEAARRADLFNGHRHPAAIGLEYIVIGPVDEQTDFAVLAN